MIDPENITNYKQSYAELEEFILFWVCAAGKNGRTAARCLDKFLKNIGYHELPFDSPFDVIEDQAYDDLPNIMKDAGIGCFNQKARTFAELIESGIDLKKCSVDDLEAIHGIGMKTARCFLIHSRRDVRLAGIDTHMLKHLKAVGVPNVPSSTPSNKKEYVRLENEFLKLADEAGKAPAVFDLEIWNKYSIKSEPKNVNNLDLTG